MHNQMPGQKDPPSSKSPDLTAMNVASILNPVKSEPQGKGTRLPSSPSPLIPPSSSPSYSKSELHLTPSPIKRQKMAKDGALFSKGGKLTGDVRYPPFENLDKEVMSEIQKFHVYPIGKIQEYCRHIPYNSEKKMFLEKTGRESFEVFQYIFKVPGDDKDYTVMWDYNIGLVRITPFFKCSKYSKTTPARMLSHNPGLKEITHSITGGALAAQGYWMPYQCALAMCATFCHHIAAALIPIFGPSFPSICVPPEAPEHGRMVIDPSIIATAAIESEAYRAQYSFSSTKAEACCGTLRSPRTHQPSSHSIPPGLDRRSRLKRAFEADTSYTDTDTDNSSGNYYCSPNVLDKGKGTNDRPAWRTTNFASTSVNASIKISSASKSDSFPHSYAPLLPNPILSAIPRSTGLPDHWRSVSKRRIEEIETDTDGAYDGEESANVSVVTDDKSIPEAGDKITEIGQIEAGGGDEEKKAAFWLLNLHIKDSESKEKDVGEENSRVKRLRATASV